MNSPRWCWRCCRSVVIHRRWSRRSSTRSRGSSRTGELLEFTTYISLSCQNCPDVVQALNLMAVLNPRVRHTMVDGALFEQEVAAQNIKSVPSIHLEWCSRSGRDAWAWRKSSPSWIGGATQRAAAQMSQQAPYDMLIVGGGPAGASAAVYAARKGIRVAVAAERFGGQVLDTLGIENLISVEHTEGPELARALEQNVRQHEVADLQPAARRGTGAGRTAHAALRQRRECSRRVR